MRHEPLSRREIGALLIVLLLLAAISVAHADTWPGDLECCGPLTISEVVQVGGTVTLTWVAPTTNTDGSAITGALAYQVDAQAPWNGPEPLPSVGGTTDTVTAVYGDTCYTVEAIELMADSDGEMVPVYSAPSSRVCVRALPAGMSPQAPDLPTNVTLKLSWP